MSNPKPFGNKPTVEDASDRDAICDWFADMTFVNQFAAAANPEGWARAQTQTKRPDMYDEFVRRANIWREYVESMNTED